MIRKLPNSATFYQDIDDVTAPRETPTPKRFAFRRISVPVSLKDKEYLHNKAVYCSEQFLPKDFNSHKATKVSDVLPSIYFPLCSEEEGQHPAKDEALEVFDSEILSPETVKTFKSLAHKK